MTAKEIRAVLEPKGLLVGINLYPGEPTGSAHAVSVSKGKAHEAIDAIVAAGGSAYHSHSFGPYSEGICVRRKFQKRGGRTS